MAKKKETKAETPVEEKQTPAAENQSSQVENAAETTSETGETPLSEGAPQGDAPAPVTDQAPAAEKDEPLFSLEELEMKHRAPSWQHSALKRLMGWASGKKVAEREYEAALNQLNNRRQGGGRR